MLAASLPATARPAAPFATVGTEVFAEGAFLPAKFESRYRRQIAVNGFRSVAVGRLLVARGTACRLTAEPAEIAAYLSWWQGELRRMATVAETSPQPQAALAAGFRRDAVVVTSSTAPAVAEARKEVERWRVFACVQSTLGGDHFFIPRGLSRFMGADIRPETVISYRAVEGGLVRPDTSLVEPTEAIGKLVAEAYAAGRISFANPADSDYFKARYTDPAFANATGSGVAAEVARPYWFGSPPS